MLTCFLKDPKDQGVVCSIIKFSERIWILDREGNAKVLRTFLIKNEDPTNSIENLKILIPSLKVTNFQDYSHTALDRDYYWNYRTKGIYEIINEKEGLIKFDNLSPVRVFKLILNSQIVADSTLLDINLQDPIGPTQIRLIRIVFSVEKLCKVVESYMFFDLPYFSKSHSLKAVNLLAVTESLQIPAHSILNLDTKDGGFDVHLIAPPKMVLSSNFGSPTTGLCPKDIDGKDIEEREAMLWRLRNYLGGMGVGKLSVDLYINGTIYEPIMAPVLDRVRDDINKVKDDINKVKSDTNKVKGKLTLHIFLVIFSIILAIIAIILNFIK